MISRQGQLRKNAVIATARREAVQSIRMWSGSPRKYLAIAAKALLAIRLLLEIVCMELLLDAGLSYKSANPAPAAFLSYIFTY